MKHIDLAHIQSMHPPRHPWPTTRNGQLPLPNRNNNDDGADERQRDTNNGEAANDFFCASDPTFASEFGRITAPRSVCVLISTSSLDETSSIYSATLLTAVLERYFIGGSKVVLPGGHWGRLWVGLPSSSPLIRRSSWYV
jgi:hypothetical protein